MSLFGQILNEIRKLKEAEVKKFRIILEVETSNPDFDEYVIDEYAKDKVEADGELKVTSAAAREI